jgi:PKD repeat protein
MSANQTNGTAPITVAFTGTGTDYDGTITSYDWDFGDGTNSTLQNPTHTYTDIGVYTATLTVTDDDGSMGFDSVVIINGEIATPIVASASSYIADGYQAENAIDGNDETYWMSNVLDYPNWIMFDFGEQVAIHSICASVPEHALSVFDVSVSNDTASWDVAVEDVSVTSSSAVEVVINTSQRYVKLTFDDLNVIEGCNEFYAILSPPIDPCVLYDTNSNCYIEMSEIAVAIEDWQAGTLEMSDLAILIGYWQSGESYCE